MSNKRRRCTNCKDYYPASDGILTPGGWFHEYSCASKYAMKKSNALKQKRVRKQHVQDKLKIKTKSQWLREAQQAFNKYIRRRDRGRPCISCDKPDNGTHQRHASHYRSVGACSSLRFNTYNVHASCQQCNAVLSGNLIEYRIRLIKKLGHERVDWLESQNVIVRYDIEYAKSIKMIFNKKARRMEKGMSDEF